MPARSSLDNIDCLERTLLSAALDLDFRRVYLIRRHPQQILMYLKYRRQPAPVEQVPEPKPALSADTKESR
jgi:hypothetical protein